MNDYTISEYDVRKIRTGRHAAEVLSPEVLPDKPAREAAKKVFDAHRAWVDANARVTAAQTRLQTAQQQAKRDAVAAARRALAGAFVEITAQPEAGSRPTGRKAKATVEELPDRPDTSAVNEAEAELEFATRVLDEAEDQFKAAVDTYHSSLRNTPALADAVVRAKPRVLARIHAAEAELAAAEAELLALEGAARIADPAFRPVKRATGYVDTWNAQTSRAFRDAKTQSVSYIDALEKMGYGREGGTPRG